MYKAQRIIPLTLLLSLTLVACVPASEEPGKVAQKYWQYLQNGNTVEAEKFVSANSKYAFSESKNRIATITQLSNSEAITTVKTTITTVNPENNYKHTQTFDTYLVLQDGEWKVDVNRTPVPSTPLAREDQLQQMADELSESMQENIESIDEAVTEGMQMLNEALHEGSKDMGDSLLHLMNELNRSMQESVDKIKKRRQQQLEDQQKEQPDSGNGEGMI